MKRIHYALCIMHCALIFALTMAITSCKDDDKDNEKEPTAQQKEQQAEQLAAEAEAFWSVVGQLTTVENRPEDWKNATFEPTYGEQDESNAFTRVRIVNDVEEAALLYSYIVNIEDFDENTPTHTFENSAVGTLKYTRSTDGKSLATVDVNIKQMPHLQKIVFKTPDQLGTNTIWNGNFDGSAYYRFGDVVAKFNEEGKKEYWICVRPPFSYEYKGDSHWITLSSLPKKNLFHHPGSNGVDYYLPKDLGDDKENELNFAEMLYAIFFPDEWEANLRNPANKKLDYFNGFDKEQLDVHNKWFWKRVAEAWKEAQILGHCFGNMPWDDLKNGLAADGLTLIYDASWWTSVSWKPYIYARNYSGTNLTKRTKKSYNTNVEKKLELDLSGSYWLAFQKNSKYFGDAKPRWCIRHATGKELGGHDDPKRKLDGEIEEIYNYNNRFIADKNLAEDDAVIPDHSESLHGYYVPGVILKDFDGNRWICVQTRLETNVGGEYNYGHSYFISFDSGALRSGNDLLANLPSRNLAWQMLYQLESYFSNYIIHKADGASKTLWRIIKETYGIDLEEYLPMHAFRAEGHPLPVKVFCGNALYKDNENKTCVARLVYDMAALQPNGGRSMQFLAYDRYTTTTAPARRMYLDDLYDQGIINQYRVENKWGDKPWIVAPFLDEATAQYTNFIHRQHPITETALDKWYNQPGFKFQNTVSDEKAGFNMYLEPVLVFAVKRLEDHGTVNASGCFDDGTKIRDYKFLDVNDDAPWRNDLQDSGVASYPLMLGNTIFINDQLEGFGIDNAR